ncbi:hypothetical protein F5882DRAFT_474452 [Hyaloscypha sp. PMI_1271]|nr:hypothetical protein F5882DRAFT_474452 [Hyaloscypha sp. PMI_1271]
MPGKVMYLVEQVRRELGPKKYILGETNIRAPKLIAYGMEDDLGLDPFVITEFIKGKTLDKLWKENPKEPRSGLRSDIDEKVQEIVYRQVANILLELAEHNCCSLLRSTTQYHEQAQPLPLPLPSLPVQQSTR